MKLTEKYGHAGTILHVLLHMHAYATYSCNVNGDVGRIFFAFDMNIALLQWYHYVFYVDATYQTNHEGYRYRLSNIISSTATRRTFIVAQALIRDETTATVQ